MDSGSRGAMLQAERIRVEAKPGPLNSEPWAGLQRGGQP